MKRSRDLFTVPQEDEHGHISADISCSVLDVRNLLKDIRIREGPDQRKVLNYSQFEVVKKVVDRVCDEMDVLASGDYDALSEPLHWSMHGGPGTGETHVINILKKELFEKVLKWNFDVKFQIVALQAVVADLLSGDTIHHAFNLPVFGKSGSEPAGDKGDLNTMKAILQLRWLIIDQVSMVSARLLADIDAKLRSFARVVDPYVKDEKSATICRS